MWFKNITLFRLADAPKISAAALSKTLALAEFRPCTSQELLGDGWVAPLGRRATDLVHEVNGCLLVCLQIEEKLLPPAVIKEEIAEKVFEIEEREGRRVGRKERDQLRDDVMLALLPRAFTRSRRSYAYLDLSERWLVIDSASAKGVEEITVKLREAFGSLPIAPPVVKSSPAKIMTDWLKKRPPGDIVLEDECELRDGEGVVRCKGQDLESDEILNHLRAGKQVTRLALQWNDRFSLLLGDDLLLRRLRFLDVLQEQIDDVHRESEEQLFDAQFALMSAELRQFFPRLLEFFDGESES